MKLEDILKFAEFKGDSLRVEITHTIPTGKTDRRMYYLIKDSFSMINGNIGGAAPITYPSIKVYAGFRDGKYIDSLPLSPDQIENIIEVKLVRAKSRLK